MKPALKELDDLKNRIRQSLKVQSRSYAELGRLATVDPGQVWRICSGDFRTISNNVVQVCKVLGVPVETVRTGLREDDVSWDRLELSLRNLWDQTPEGADRIARILDTMAEWRTDRREHG